MNLVIHSISAISFWLNYNQCFIGDPFSLKKRKLVSLPENPEFFLNKKTAEALSAKLNLKYPLNLYAMDTKVRCQRQYVRTNRLPCLMPKESFVELTDYVKAVLPFGSRLFVACPELAFLNMAAQTDFRQLIFLGTELCGRYVHCDEAKYKQLSRDPICSVESLQNFIEKTAGMKGHQRAKRACQYINNNSNSFIETMLAVMCSLPPHLGGYALGGFELNKEIKLSKNGANLIQRESLCCDFVWEFRKVILEYDSDLTHLNSTQHAKDALRIRALSATGYTVVPVTNGDLSSLSKIDTCFFDIRKQLGMRRNKQLFAKYTRQRQELIYIFRHFNSCDHSTYLPATC